MAEQRQLTITEALAEIKTIGKRLGTKREFVLEHMLRHEALRDPLEAQGGSAELIKRERQAIHDLEEDIIKIRSAIQLVNATTEITIKGKTRSVTEWLAWRKEIAQGQGQFLRAIRERIKTVRTAQQEGRVPRIAPQLTNIHVQASAVNQGENKPAQIKVEVNEEQLSQETEGFEEIFGQLDGQLSLKNATTMIRI